MKKCLIAFAILFSLSTKAQLRQIVEEHLKYYIDYQEKIDDEYGHVYVVVIEKKEVVLKHESNTYLNMSFSDIFKDWEVSWVAPNYVMYFEERPILVRVVGGLTQTEITALQLEVYSKQAAVFRELNINKEVLRSGIQQSLIVTYTNDYLSGFDLLSSEFLEEANIVPKYKPGVKRVVEPKRYKPFKSESDPD